MSIPELNDMLAAEAAARAEARAADAEWEEYRVGLDNDWPDPYADEDPAPAPAR
jgi:hypothetical protein